MKKYEFPLRIVEGSPTTNNIVAAHMLYDCMTPEELMEQAPEVEDEIFDTQKHPRYYFDALGMNLSARFATIGEEEEIEKQPKNYAVALSGAMDGNIEAAKEVMEYLIDLNVYNEPVDSSEFDALDISWEEIRGEPVSADITQLDLDRFKEVSQEKVSEDELVNDVYRKFVNREETVFPPNERGFNFLLGRQLRLEDSEVAFEVGPSGPASTRYDISPDIDVLEFRSDGLRVGYEMKGLRKGGELKKEQLYKGLGQALTLLSQPSDARGSAVVDKAYLAYPGAEGHNIGMDETWLNSFQNVVSESPVGLVEVGIDEYEIIEESETSPMTQSRISLKLDKSHPNSIRHPEKGLPNLARKIIEGCSED